MYLMGRGPKQNIFGISLAKSILTAVLGPRLLSGGYSLLPEEKLALSISLLLFVAAVILLI